MELVPFVFEGLMYSNRSNISGVEWTWDNVTGETSS